MVANGTGTRTGSASLGYLVPFLVITVHTGHCGILEGRTA